MTNLSVNVNKVALVRNQRDAGYPDVRRAARMAVQAGAQGITVHPRPDGRHIRHDDVTALAAMLRDEFAGRVEFNVEGYPSSDFLELVRLIRPTQTTLVPDPPEVRTSDSGWDIRSDAAMLGSVIEALHDVGTRVALFIEPDAASVRGSARVGAHRIELYTAHYARSFGTDQEKAVLGRYVAAAALAKDIGLGTNAGHDLNLENLATFRRAIPWLLEVSIGHFLWTDALSMGLTSSVQAYLAALRPAAA